MDETAFDENTFQPLMDSVYISHADYILIENSPLRGSLTDKLHTIISFYHSTVEV